MGDIHKAASRGDVQAVRKILASSAIDKDVVDDFGYTPLHLAAQFGRKEVVELLLGMEAKTDARDKDGRTPLHYAAHGDLGWVTQLAAGSRTDDSIPKVPMDYLGVVKLLLDHGAKKNETDRMGQTPLHFAAKEGCKEAVVLLIEEANKDQKDIIGRTALDLAIEYGREEVVDLLLSVKATIGTPDSDRVWVDRDRYRYEPLHVAAKGGNARIVNRLLMAGANKDQPYIINGWAPLHFAAAQGHKEAAVVLLRAGANKNLQDIGGCTPLHLAIKYVQTKIVFMLLDDFKANVKIADKGGRTPLHYAVQLEHADAVAMVNKLLVAGSNIEQQDSEGLTPLHLAAEQGSEEVIGMLLQFTANLKSTTLAEKHSQQVFRNGLDPVPSRQPVNIDIPDKQGATPLYFAVERGCARVVFMLLKAGANIEQQDSEGCTLLHLAAKHFRAERVSMLLDFVADIDKPDNMGRTPLHYAVLEGRINVVAILLEAGAKNTPDNGGQTPLHCAVLRDHIDVVAMLLRSTVNLEQQDSKELTPLHLAVEKGFETARDMLLKAGARPSLPHPAQLSDAMMRLAIWHANEAEKGGDTETNTFYLH